MTRTFYFPGLYNRGKYCDRDFLTVREFDESLRFIDPTEPKKHNFKKESVCLSVGRSVWKHDNLRLRTNFRLKSLYLSFLQKS